MVSATRTCRTAGPPKPEKNWMIRGPIDDAFLDSFQVTGASAKPWHEEINRHVGVVEKQFSDLWDKHMRAKMPPLEKHVIKHEIFFGDPGSNPAIAKILPDLPITWTKDSLVVNGVKYDPKTHYPALIYPQKHQLAKDVIIYRYVVLNSGHTFKYADFRGTNALLYPRLGDWAVLKPKPTKEDPGAVEVVAAGIFDEFWQFKKEKK